MVIFLGLRGSNLYEVNGGGVGGRLSLNHETRTFSTTVLVIIPGGELGASQNPTNVATSTKSFESTCLYRNQDYQPYKASM